MAKATKKETEANKASGSKKDGKKKAKEEQSSLKNLQQFMKDSWTEFNKIQWPTPRQAINESIVVLIVVVFIIGLVNLYDMFSGFLLSFILQK